MDRLKEPSTWAGLAGIIGQLAIWLPGMAGMIAGGVGAAFGGVAVYLKEHHA